MRRRPSSCASTCARVVSTTRTSSSVSCLCWLGPVALAAYQVGQTVRSVRRHQTVSVTAIPAGAFEHVGAAGACPRGFLPRHDSVGRELPLSTGTYLSTGKIRGAGWAGLLLYGPSYDHHRPALARDRRCHNGCGVRRRVASAHDRSPRQPMVPRSRGHRDPDQRRPSQARSGRTLTAGGRPGHPRDPAR